VAPVNWLETAQQIITVSQRLDAALRELERDRAERQTFQKEVLDRLLDIDRRIEALGERVTRLETYREADRAAAAAELERFKLQVERARIEFAPLLRPAPSKPGEADH
jgi:hypothetical protein